MTWLVFLIIAYFLLALAALTDKFVLTKALPEPVAYAVIVSLGGLVSLVLIPFGFVLPAWQPLLASALAGLSYTLALFFLYSAVKRSEISRVTTFVGALVAIFTLIFSYLLLNERLSISQFIAFFILLAGGMLITLEFKRGQILGPSFWFIVLTGISFGFCYTASRYVYLREPFISGFIWIRIFAFLAALVLLIKPGNWQKIRQSFNQKSPIRQRSSQLMLLVGQTAGSIGLLLLNYVISISSASLTLAAQGLQYTFVLVLVLFLAKRFPRIWSEKITPLILIQKFSAIFLISGGLVILAFSNL